MADDTPNSKLNRREFLATTSAGAAVSALLSGVGAAPQKLVPLIQQLAGMPHLPCDPDTLNAIVWIGQDIPGGKEQEGASGILHNMRIMVDMYRQHLDFCDALDNLTEDSRAMLTQLLDAIKSSQEDAWNETAQALRPRGIESLEPNTDNILQLARGLIERTDHYGGLRGVQELPLPEHIQEKIHAIQNKARQEVSLLAEELVHHTGVDPATARKAVSSAELIHKDRTFSPTANNHLQIGQKEVMTAFRRVTNEGAFSEYSPDFCDNEIRSNIAQMFREAFPELQFQEPEAKKMAEEKPSPSEEPAQSKESRIYPSIFSGAKETLGQVMASLAHRGWKK